MDNIENTETNVNVNTDNQENTEEIVFTDAQKAEIAKLIQSESDRRTNQALAKQKREYEKKMSLANLDGVERERAEKDNTIAELREQLAQINIEKAKSEQKSVFAANGLPVEMVDYIAFTDDAEENLKITNAFKRAYQQAVKADVEKRLAAAGGAPKGNVTNVSGEITKEKFRAMPLSQQAQLAKDNKALYDELVKN